MDELKDELNVLLEDYMNGGMSNWKFMTSLFKRNHQRERIEVAMWLPESIFESARGYLKYLAVEADDEENMMASLSKRDAIMLSSICDYLLEGDK